MTLPKHPTQTSLKTENVDAFVDFDTRLFCIQYGQIIDAEVTAQVYGWMKEGATTWFREEDFRGGIFDFRNVKKFAIGNTPVAKKASQEVNHVNDFSTFPLALIVKNIQQATKVRMSMMENDTLRKMIVYSEDQALEFINNWNEKHGRNIPVIEDLLMTWPTPAEV